MIIYDVICAILSYTIIYNHSSTGGVLQLGLKLLLPLNGCLWLRRRGSNPKHDAEAGGCPARNATQQQIMVQILP